MENTEKKEAPRWIFMDPAEELVDWLECSECGWKDFGWHHYNFCPQCGAKMEEMPKCEH